MIKIRINYFNSILILVELTLYLICGASADIPVPDICDHSARFSALTQYVIHRPNGSEPEIAYFVVSLGYYWILDINTPFPTTTNTRGRLPFNFRGDSAFFRQWNSCSDGSAVPMIVVVDNSPELVYKLKYTVYFVQNQSWKYESPVSEDLALNLIQLYNGFKSVDTIINFSPIKVGPFADKLGDESIFIFTSAQNNTYYYDWVRLKGCVRSDGFFEGKAEQYFGGLLERAFWKMTKPVDTAMVYTEYPYSDPNVEPIEADISMFQENAHYLFSIPLDLIINGFLKYNKLSLITQYYSTWMECAEGATPEPPVLPPTKPPKTTPASGQTEQTDISDQTQESIDIDSTQLTNGTTKWRPTIPDEEKGDAGNAVHNEANESRRTTRIVLITSAIVISVLLILSAIGFLMYWFGWGLGSDKEEEEEEDNGFDLVGKPVDKKIVNKN